MLRFNRRTDTKKNAESADAEVVIFYFAGHGFEYDRRNFLVPIDAPIKVGEHELTPEQEVLDLKISDYLVEVEASDNITYQDALIIAMKRERAAYELYSDMAAKVPESHLKEVLEGLAIEEAKHKLFFEAEYDERVLMDN